jgi:hypothetical protein
MASKATREKTPEATLREQEVLLSPGNSPVVNPIVEEEEECLEEIPQRVTSQGTGNVTFAELKWQDDATKADSPRASTKVHLDQVRWKDIRSRQIRLRNILWNDIHWRSPSSMIVCLVLGILMSLGHDRYYHSLKGQIVGDPDEQQKKLRFEYP